MKRSLLLILVALTIASCSVSPNTVTSESFDLATSTYSSVEETTSDDVSCLPEGRTQDVIDEAWESRLDHNGSDLVEIPDVSISRYSDEVISYIEVDPLLYSDLSVSVEDYDHSFRGGDEPDESLRQLDYCVLRCDNRLLSLKAKARIASADAAEPTSVDRIDYVTWNYRGEELCFSDVIEDYGYFVDTVSPLIREALNDIDAIDADEILATLLYAPDGVDHEFYMTNDSLCFFVDYSFSDDEGTLVSDSVLVKVPYREYADLFDPQYLPGEGTMIWEDSSELQGVNSVCASEEYYNSLIGGTFISYSGLEYVVVKIQSGMVETLAESAAERGETFVYDDYDPPIVAIVDLESEEIIYFEQSDWNEVYDNRSLHPFGDISDTVAFVEEHV